MRLHHSALVSRRVWGGIDGNDKDQYILGSLNSSAITLRLKDEPQSSKTLR